MSNINRDYLIVLNPKTSKVTVPELNYYIYDKYTANLFVNLVTVQNGKAVNIPDADQYKLVLHVVKPTNEIQDVENIELISKEKALFQIELDQELTKNIGRYKCELLTIDKTDHIVQSAKFSYRVKKSIYNDLDVVTETPEYPIIITLLDKLQDIDKYEEERRANEVARVAAEKARVKDYTDLRQTVTTDIDTMQEKIDSFDGKVQEVDSAVQQMRTNITNYQTEKNKELDNYKTQKDTQINTAIKGMETTIDTYKTEKDKQINDKITQQDTKIDKAIDLQNKNIQASTKALNDKLDAAVQDQNDTIAANNQAQNKVISDAVAAQNKTINTVVESDKKQNDSINALKHNQISSIKAIKTLQDKDIAHEERMTAIEAVNVEQNNRLDAIEIKNDQQDSRLNDVEAKNKKQDLDLKCLFAESHSERITLEDEVGNSVFLQNSKQGFATVDELKGNTLVNCNKDTDKELILNGNIDTSGYGTVTTTEGVDGGLVDVMCEGNTMVNVCDQEDPIAITKNYEVATGNHVALQGEYDGKCRPVLNGNTLVSYQKSSIDKGKQFTVNGQYQYKSISTLNTTVKDKLYFRIKFTVDELNTTSQEVNIFTHYPGGYMTPVKLFKDCTVGKIEEASTIREHEQARADQKYMMLSIGMYAPIPEDVPEGSPVCKYTIHDYVIYNLTQLFGAGKEPEQKWCDNNLPYLKGLQSSFEDKLITDEKDANNGKYKVDYKVTGKNKFDKSKTLDGYEISNEGHGTINTNTKWFITDFIPVIPNTSYTISGKSNGNVVMCYNENKQSMANITSGGTSYITIPNNVRYIKLNGFLTQKDTFQIEEGDTATTYEPYKEYTKTFYLNSPLLKGDTIEDVNGKATHVHKYGKVVLDGSNDEGWVDNATEGDTINGHSIYKGVNIYSNGECMCDKLPVYNSSKEVENLTDFVILSSNGTVVVNVKGASTIGEVKSWLQSNPITLISKLKTPTYETISNDSILCDSYVNGHLDVDSVIPIERVVFKNSNGIELKYMYTSTDYILQFESDNVGKIDIVSLSSNIVNNIYVYKGVNKINITTKDTIPDLWLTILGIGFNASNIVVTPKVEQTFGYFKGMKSVGECEGNTVEILSQNKNIVNRKVADMKHSEGTYVTNDSGGYANPSAIIYLPKGKYIFSIDGYNVLNFVDVGIFIWKQDLLVENCRKIGTDKPFEILDGEVGFTWYGCVNKGKGETITSLVGKNIQVELGETRTSYIEPKSNKKEILLNEPLRALPNGVKDKLVIIDGKWYIERNCRAVQFKDLKYSRTDTYQKAEFPDVIGFRLSDTGIQPPILCDRFAYTNDRIINFGTLLTNKENINITSSNTMDEFFITIQKAKLQTLDFKGLMKYFTDNPMEIIAKATTPTYESIEYNPFEVYSNTTHISNNSNIPCNMVIRNSGFNCMLKPNTTYTVSSNNGLSSVVTKDSVGDSVLRFYDKDTTSVTKMNKVLVLEGDYITGNPPIPTFFKGMESTFEQQLVTDEKDKNYGKYKVNVKAVGKNLFNGKWEYDTKNNKITSNDLIKVKPSTTYTISDNLNYRYHIRMYIDKDIHTNTIYPQAGSYTFTTNKDIHYLSFSTYAPATDINVKFQLEENTKATEYEPYKENNITFYIKEPLRGVGDVKDKVYVKEDKVVVERNCASVTFSDSVDEGDWYMQPIGHYQITSPYNIHLKQNLGAICNKLPVGDNTDQVYIFPILQGDISYIRVQNGVTKWKTLEQFKQYLQQNPITVIYQLATPTYEEVEYFDLKLFVEIFKDTTIIYNSNIPVTSTINYTYATPLTDAVNTVSDISDEQDSMIIDMAAQVATMEMMLM